MPSYLSLVNWTDKGIAEAKESPARLEGAKKTAEAEGGKFIFFYMLMGEYDLAALTEFPDDAAAARFALKLGQLGTIRTTTLKAFTEDEFRALVSAL